jgi:hypothetical protein
MKIQNINNSGWSVLFIVDEDGHLTLSVSHKDGSKPIDCDHDCDFDGEFGVRLSTEKIEADYRSSLEKEQLCT